VGYTREVRVKADSVADVERENARMQLEVDGMRKH